MKKKSTGHGPVAILDEDEKAALQKALTILEGMHEIESEGGEIHISEEPLIVASYGSLLGLMREREY